MGVGGPPPVFSSQPRINKPKRSYKPIMVYSLLVFQQERRTLGMLSQITCKGVPEVKISDTFIDCIRKLYSLMSTNNDSHNLKKAMLN